MRRWLIGIVALLVVGAAAFFLLAPGMIERGLNKVDGKPLPTVSARAAALHKTLTIVDLHSDSLLWGRNFLNRATRGHMDLPRLEEGNVALQILSSTTKSPKGQNYDANGDDSDNITGAGVRMAGITHFFDNIFAGSMHGMKKGGLTPLGRDLIGRMEAKGMIVDIAHCSHTCVADILKMARRPVVSSHGGVQATCKVNRNLTDDEIRGVAATGGVIGIGYWDAAVCATSPARVARAVKHVRDLVGIPYVALGRDYDGATTVRFDTSKLVQVTQALLDAGFSDDEIRAAMGGNALRVIRAGIVPLGMGTK